MTITFRSKLQAGAFPSGLIVDMDSAHIVEVTPQPDQTLRMTVSPAPTVELLKPPSARLQSIDIIRGIVMILMALDHVRVFAGVSAGGVTNAMFFTRWITHFCAPAFVFFAGTGAFFHGRKLGDLKHLSRFLVTRGLWLIVLEFTFLRFAWTFNGQVSGPLLGGIIWVIGICMVLMGGLIWLGPKKLGWLGLLILAGHNLLDPYIPGQLFPRLMAGEFSWASQFLYLGGPVWVQDQTPTIFILYSIVPWIGVMGAGYGFGLIMAMPRDKRRQYCLWIGISATALFVILRGFNLYGNPTPWQGTDQISGFLSFLKTNKYPASFQFLLMTLGPTIIALPFLDSVKGRVAGVCKMFGRVPLFFYLLHIPLIHLAAIVVSFLRNGEVSAWLFDNHPVWINSVPDGFAWGLSLLYATWVGVVILLYFPCKWFEDLKRRRKDWWLSYL